MSENERKDMMILADTIKGELKANGFSTAQINEIVNALEGEAYRVGVKYVVDKLRARLYYVPGAWIKQQKPDVKMIYDIIERAIDECAEHAQIGGEE